MLESLDPLARAGFFQKENAKNLIRAAAYVANDLDTAPVGKILLNKDTINGMVFEKAQKFLGG
ncbi:hypothetical protein MPNT_30142 [Candidatus Methylacidithermus pantelleriae]|uniref:Uncharacterized protein n=1 Tax=Candidatus Methylacidithermus pantelleriae TaxID=2744239 RepID=A0A8J2BQK0_9BACT|nr:hypothetical protein MPNT_30142 [Candidatus Methylacidithermus pantelleriae]